MADLTENIIAKRIYQRLKGRVNEARIIERIPEARTMLAVEIATSKDKYERELLIDTFTLSGSSGVYSLSSAKAEAEPLLAQTLSRATITHADNPYRLQFLPDRSAANLDRSNQFIYCWVEGDDLCTLNTDGETDTLSGDLTVRGHKVPSLATISDQPPLKERFVDLLERLCEGQPQEAAP